MFEKISDEGKSERELEELFEEAAKHGAVLALLHFDAHGPDSEAVKNALIEFVGRITQEPGVIYCIGEVEKVLKQEEMFSTYTEVKVLTDSFNRLLQVCMKYGPVAVEILKPAQINLTLEEAHNTLLDASRTAQEYSLFLLQKLMKPEDYEVFQEQLKKRAEAGKKMLEQEQEKK